mgnify:CR=1 FL=1
MNGPSERRDVVLVVEDSPESLSMINDTLEQAGVTVLVSLDGQQALTIASNLRPDIILMDALMPHMDGFETCRRLKSDPELAHIPVIFMTGLTDTASIVRALQSGGVDYINKPVNGEELIARMRVHLANARLAFSARVALDNAGQFVFGASTTGMLMWATPQAYQLFEAAGVAADWLKAQFPGEIRAMLAQGDDGERGRSITAGDKLLELRYIGRGNGDEHLFRLLDPEGPSDTERLCSAFAITKREAQVLFWVARGKTNREIAIILSMSPRTVNKHLEQIYRKLGVENRTSAAAMALIKLGS